MLTLPIKGKWYDMIRSGEKLEEYRANTPYYDARFARHLGKPVKVRFRNGYRADSPTMEVVIRPMFRKGAKPEWGGDPDKFCWVLEILNVIELERISKEEAEHGTAQV